MNFYISDCHFGHKNIIAYDQRPFFSVEEMDAAMIQNWQKVVSDNDTVYILGDFCWGNATMWANILDQLPGYKVAIFGNHDQVLRRNKELQKRFVAVESYMEIRDGENNIVLCHYPIPFYKNIHYGWYHFYGHVHTSNDFTMTKKFFAEISRTYDIKARAYNVGACLLDYTPRMFSEIVDTFNFGC